VRRARSLVLAVAAGLVLLAGRSPAVSQGNPADVEILMRMNASPPAVTVAKVQTPAAPGAGGTVTWRVDVRNAGLITITDLTVTDTVPGAVVNLASAQPSAFAAPAVASVPGSGTVFAWSGTGLTFAPGATFSFTLTGQVGALCGSTSVSNTAYVTASYALAGTTAYSNAAGFTAGPAALTAGASLAQTPPSGTVLASGSPVTYRIVVTNTGGATVTDVTVSDTLPPQFSAAGTAEPSGFGPPLAVAVAGGTRFVWSASGLALVPGTTLTFTVTGAAGLVGAATQVSTTAAFAVADACGRGAAGVSGPAGMTILPDISLSGSLALLGPPTLSVGQAVLVTLTVTNGGSATATNVLAGLWRSMGSGAAAIAGPEPAAVPALAGGATVTFTFTLTASAPGSAAWTATATADGPLSSAGATGPLVTIQPAASLSAAASASVSGACPGGGFQYTLTVSNATGAAQADAVTPTFSLAGTSAGASAGGPAPASASLPGGASQAFVWNVTAGGAGTVIATASATGQDANAGWNTGAPATAGALSATVTVQSAATLSVAIAAPPSGTLIAGQPSTIAVVVTNAGGADAVLTSAVIGVTNGAGGTFTGPSPASLTVSATASGVFTFTYTPPAGFAGPAALSATVSGTSCGALAAAGAGMLPVEPPPSQLVVTGLTLSPGPVVAVGSVIAATLTVANPGGRSATAYGLTVAEATSAPGELSARGTTLPVLPVVLGPGANATFGWSYTVLGCGTLSVSAAVSGTGEGAGGSVLMLGPVSGGSNLLALHAGPARVVGSATPPSALVASQTQIEFDVQDACGQPVPAQDLVLSVFPSDALLGATRGTTAADGSLRTSLRLSAARGANLVRADVTSAPGVFGTLTVTGTVPAAGIGYLSQNFFDPGRGEALTVRAYAPGAVELSIRVYNVAGERVRLVGLAQVVPGMTEWRWDGRNDQGDLVGNGVYFIQVIIGSDAQIRKVVVLKK